MPRTRDSDRALSGFQPLEDAVEPSHALAMDGCAGLDPALALELARSRGIIWHVFLWDARGTLNQLEAEFHDVYACLEGERLHLARGWRQLKVVAKLSHLQHESTP